MATCAHVQKYVLNLRDYAMLLKNPKATIKGKVSDISDSIVGSKIATEETAKPLIEAIKSLELPEADEDRLLQKLHQKVKTSAKERKQRDQQDCKTVWYMYTAKDWSDMQTKSADGIEATVSHRANRWGITCPRETLSKLLGIMCLAAEKKRTRQKSKSETKKKM